MGGPRVTMHRSRSLHTSSATNDVCILCGLQKHVVQHRTEQGKNSLKSRGSVRFMSASNAPIAQEVDVRAAMGGTGSSPLNCTTRRDAALSSLIADRPVFTACKRI